MMNLINKAIRYGQGVLGLRRDDVILASFPKSGNTWMRFFFCNLISACEWDGKVVEWKTLDGTMPELGADNLLKPWPYHTIPRIVKTHKPFWPLFKGHKSILMVRDPRDVMVSYYHHVTSTKNPRYTGNISGFIRTERFGLQQWFKHYESWQERYTILVRYEQLRKAEFEEFANLLEQMGISVSDEVVRMAVERSKFDSIRSIEKQYGSPKPDELKETFLFTRSGKSGGWKESFTEEDLAYYEQMKAKHRFDLY